MAAENPVPAQAAEVVKRSEGLRRVITCRVPGPALDRLKAADAPLMEAASSALATGLGLVNLDDAKEIKGEKEARLGWTRFSKRPLAFAVTAEEFEGIGRYAKEVCDGDQREAGGILIGKGLGIRPRIVTAEDLAREAEARAAAEERRAAQSTQAPVRWTVPPRRRPERREPLPPDDAAPNGDELKQRREGIGISQRDLAAAAGLTRGLVAEVERGRRKNVLTRLRISETLASLER